MGGQGRAGFNSAPLIWVQLYSYRQWVKGAEKWQKASAGKYDAELTKVLDWMDGRGRGTPKAVRTLFMYKAFLYLHFEVTS